MKGMDAKQPLWWDDECQNLKPLTYIELNDFRKSYMSHDLTNYKKAKQKKKKISKCVVNRK